MGRPCGMQAKEGRKEGRKKIMKVRKDVMMPSTSMNVVSMAYE